MSGMDWQVSWVFQRYVLKRRDLGHGADTLQYQGIGTVRARADPSHPPEHPDSSKMGASRLSHIMDRMQVTDDASDSSDDEGALEDDGLTSSSDEDDEPLGTDVLGDHRSLLKSPERMMEEPGTAVPPPKQADDVPKTAGLLAPTIQRPASRQTSLPGYFDKSGARPDEGSAPATPRTMTPGGTKRRPIFRSAKSTASSSRKTRRDFNFDANKRDVLGIVVMEVCSASDLPKIKNCKHL